MAVDDSYLFNLDGEVKGQVSKRRRADGGKSMPTKEVKHLPALTSCLRRCIAWYRLSGTGAVTNLCIVT